MPLRPGGSKAVVSQNIRELHTGKTYAHTSAKFGKAKANKQAIAIALSNARKYAEGGDVRTADPANINTDYIPRPVRIRMQREEDARAARAAGVNPSPPLQVVPKAYGGPSAPKPPGLAKPVPLGGPPKAKNVDLNPSEGIERMAMRGSLYGLRHEGMINSTIPGRTDKLPMNVKAGSYVLPADIPSALGQGNSMAGGQILKHMFSSGPAGPTMRGASRMAMPRMNFVKPPSMGSMGRMGKPGGFAAGGTNREQPQSGGAESGMDEQMEHVPIIAAGGEYLIDPAVVRDIGHGDIKAGHRVLDKFVLNTRKKHIETLRKLKPPKK